MPDTINFRNRVFPFLYVTLALPCLVSAAVFTVSKDGRGAFSSIQAAVNQAGKGDVVEVLDAAVYPEQVTLDSTKNGLTLRAADPTAFQKPTIRFQDVIHQNPKTCQDALSQNKIDFDQNGALRLIRVRNVTIDGLAIDAAGPAPFSWPNIWGNGNDCTGQLFPLFHGNGGIAIYISGQITVRNCDISGAFFGIAVKDRNEGGAFANFNPADLEKYNIVPLSGFGRTGNHVFEKNRIHNNTWGFFFESLWDLGSTLRYNLIYDNHHATPQIATAVKAMPDGENQPGGAVLFKDAMISPLGIYNNTFWHNFTLFAGGYRPGAQHLIFNNIFAEPYQYYSQNVYQNPFHILDPFFVNRMHNCLYAAQSDPPKLDSQKVQAQQYDQTKQQQVVKDSTVKLYRAVRIMNNMGNVAQESFVVNLTLPMSSGPVVVPQTVSGVNLPGGVIGGAATEAFPIAAGVRWDEIKFKSTDPSSPDFLSPDWNDEVVKKFVRNGGWSAAGVYNSDGQVADLGAVPSVSRHADDILIRPLSPVLISGTSAILNFDLSAVTGGMASPKIKYIKLVKSIPINLNGFGGSPTLIVPPPADVTPSATDVKMGGNTLTATGFSALADTESSAFFELLVEGAASNGKPATTNVGFLPYRKLDYKFAVEILDSTGAKIKTVKAGVTVRLRVTPLKLDGTPFLNPITPVQVNLNSGSDLLTPGTPPSKLALTQVVGATERPVLFTKVPPGGFEYVTVSGIWKNGNNTLAFYGVSDGVKILPGDPEKTVFQDPPSKILNPGSAPVIDPGLDYTVKVEVRDRFDNTIVAPAQVDIKSNQPAIGDIDGPKTATTDSSGTATFKAKVTGGLLNQTFELEAGIAGKTADKADLKVGKQLFQPHAVAWAAVYADNGLGRVDRLEIHFKEALKNPPDSIELSWPGQGLNTRVCKSGIASDPADSMHVTVRIADPFPAGLTGASGSPPPGQVYLHDTATPGLPGQVADFTVIDSAGPLLDSARVQEKTGPGDDTLFVSFTELVSAPGLKGASLILIKKDGSAPVTLSVLSVNDLNRNNGFKIAVADLGTKAPQAGDSLKINPLGPLRDIFGNPAHPENQPVVLLLKTVPRPPLLTIQMDKPFQGVDRPAQSSDFLVLMSSDSRTWSPAQASNAQGKAVDCLSQTCGDAVVADQDGLLDRPAITLISDRAFKYAVTIFTNLGGYVNGFSGEMTNARLGLDDAGIALPGVSAPIGKDAQGRFVFKIAWNARSHDNELAGTGAYLAKVELSSRAVDDNGNPFVYKQARVIRFGLLKK